MLRLLLAALLCPAADALTLGSRFPTTWASVEPRAMIQASASFEVCQNKYCRKKGAVKTLKIFQELVPEGTVVQVADMSHTEHGCFDECMMGPNVRVGGEDGRILNGVKGEAAIAELLGVPLPEPQE